MDQSKRPMLEILSWIIGIVVGIGTLVAFLLPKSEKPQVVQVTNNNSQTVAVSSVNPESVRPPSSDSSNTREVPSGAGQRSEKGTLQVREVNGFELTIKGCGYRGGALVCNFLLEMKRQGSESISYYPNKVVATFPDGVAAAATRVVLGNKESRKGKHVLYTMSPNTPTAMALEIGDLANAYSEIKNLKVKLDHMEFNFRDISVS